MLQGAAFCQPGLGRLCLMPSSPVGRRAAQRQSKPPPLLGQGIITQPPAAQTPWSPLRWLCQPQGGTLPAFDAVEKHCQTISTQSHSVCIVRMENTRRTSLAGTDRVTKCQCNANWGLCTGPGGWTGSIQPPSRCPQP